MLNSLNVSHTGLNAAKIAVENVSNNIANESTPGYKKRVVQLSELERMDGRFTGRGVSANSAYRVTSQYMYDKLMSENTKSNYYDKLSTMLGNVESIFQETEDSGFSSDLNRYFQSLENLRSNPNSQVYRTTLVSNANAMVESLNNLYSAVKQQQKLEKEDLGENVKIVNDILQEIGLLNEKMGKLNEVSNDLLDKRDQLELELSKYVDVSVDRRDDQYELKIASVVAVRFNTNIRDVSINEEKINQVDKYIKDNNIDSNIEFADGFGINDKISYKLNNEHEVTVSFGESIVDANGNSVDLGSGTNVVDSTNYLRALVYKINNDANMKEHVNAYNGTRYLSSGQLITDNTKDNYLRIEAKTAGLDGSFEGRITIIESDGVDETNRDAFYKNEYQSTDAQDRAFLAVYNEEVNLKSGIIKAQTENLTSDNGNNKYQVYLDKLDDFAQTLADLSDSYINSGNDNYIYGEASSDENLGDINKLGLFSGSSVKNLTFHQNKVNDLTQEDLDYLATIQWKKDLSFTGKAQDSSDINVSSLQEFFQNIKISISSNKEANDFLMDTQESVKQSLQTSYDQLVKVDKDEEMLNLMKFQAAYTANAKIVTAIDEMIQVLLGLKR